ncbi:MAG: hypothetical protein E6J28_08795 [Chloroflexi bacterium]|nr:MAG: hypothetical protein E6J28_08795 [Chloroflexota bacterium]
MTTGVIATPHHVASEVGAQILRDGGNAIDAAIAADAVLCVVYPHMTSVGGDLMAIVWPAGASAPVGLIGAGRSGEHATIDAVRSRGFEEMPSRGVLSVTVPGTVEAWGRLLERFGSVGLGTVLEPAAELAQGGYVISAVDERAACVRALPADGAWHASAQPGPRLDAARPRAARDQRLLSGRDRRRRCGRHQEARRFDHQAGPRDAPLAVGGSDRVCIPRPGRLRAPSADGRAGGGLLRAQARSGTGVPGGA